MGRFGRFEVRGLKELQKQVDKLNQEQRQQFMEECAKELAARLLAKVIKRTPVGEYPSSTGKMGGTLRRGWTAEKTSNAKNYAASLTVHQYGGYYVIEIVNPVDYASYVEYGHRTANHKGWVRGVFMLTISEQEIEAAAPAILQQKLYRFLSKL